MRVLCLLVVCLTFVIAVHYHNDGHLDCAKHCPSCASLHASAPKAVVAVLLLSYVTLGTITLCESRIPLTLLAPNLYVRPPPVAA